MRSFEAGHDIDADECTASRSLLLIDREGRVEWAAATGDLGMGRRHCWEILGCKATSRRNCKAIQLFQRNALAGIDHDDGSACSYPSDRCLISSFPRSSDCLLVWGPEGRAVPQARSLLQRLSTLASTILTVDLVQGTETMLEFIRIATGADDCELFLADLYGKELLLAACLGSDRTTLLKRIRFESGEGLPGLVLSEGQPVTTLQLVPEDRFDLGNVQPAIQAFLSVPIAAPDGRVVGCVDLGWRRRDIPVQGLANMLWSAMPPLGSAICAAYWTYRQIVIPTDVREAEQTSESLLQALHNAVGANAGSLVMWDERDRRMQRLDVFGSAPPTCPWLASREASPCLSRTNESCFRLLALGPPSDRGPGPCRQMCFDGASVCCIPIIGQPNRIGRLLVGFRDLPSEHSGRLLVPLQVMAEQVGMHLREPSPATPVVVSTIPHLDIRCFGPFEVAIGKSKLGPSSFPRRDALTLLKMLVLRAGKQVHRERLIDWLWPDASERSGINRLHGVVHALRAAIEPHAAERRWTYLLNEGETYTFFPAEATSVDLITFQENIALARRDLREGAFVPQAIDYLEQAVELYRGDLYEEDQYCEWCYAERIALQREFLDALANLVRIYLTLGETRQAIDTLRRALTYDSSREDLHNELIRCLMRQRRYNEAKDQVRECVRQLREEVGVEPSSETQRLYHSLFNTDWSGSPSSRSVAIKPLKARP